MATSVGQVFLEVVPSLDKFASLLSAGTINDVKKIGQQAGSEFGAALTAGSASNIEALKSSLSSAALATERASTQVAAAHATAAGAADKVNVAEAKLAEARQKYAADSSQVAAAEARLAAAKRENELQAGKTALAENTLADAQARQAASATKLKAAQDEGTVTAAGLAKGVTALTVGVGAAAVAIGVIGVKSAADFQTQLTRLSTSAGETTANLGLVGDGILKMSGDVGTSTTELTSGMYTVESAGFHGAEGLTVLKAAAQGAKEENAQLSTVANAVTDILTDYHLPAQQAADVTSKLVTAVSLGKTNFEDLSGAMSSIAPLASAAHIPLQDMLGDLAEMTAHGVSADQAAQNLANTVRSLSNPTQTMTQELSQLGIRSDDVSRNLGKTGISGAVMSISDAILQHMGPAGSVLLSTFNQSKIAAEDANKMYQGLPPSLQKVADQFKSGKISMNEWRQGLKGLPADQAALLQQWASMQNNANGFSQALKSGSTSAQTYTQALAKATGNATSMNVALMLTGENAESTLGNIDKIASATNEAGGDVAGWSEIQGTFNQKLAEAEEGFKAFIIQIGQKLLPAATAALTMVMDFGHALADMGHWVQDNANWLGIIAAVVGGLVGPILAVKSAMLIWAGVTKTLEIAQAALNLVMEANPIMLIVTAIAAVVAGLIYAYFHFEGFRNVVNAVGNAIKVAFLAVVGAVEVAFHAIVVAVQAVGSAFVWLYNNAIKPAYDGWVLIFHGLAAAATWLWSTILQPVFNFIGQAAVILAKIILAVAITPIVLAVKGLGIVFGWLWDNAIKPAFDGIATAAVWVFNNVIGPQIEGAKIILRALGDLFSWLYNNAVKPALDWIGQRWQEMRIGFQIEWNFIRDNILQPVADFFVHVVWENGIKVALDWIADKWKWARQVFDEEWRIIRDDILQPVVDFFIHTVWENGIKRGLDSMGDGFRSAVSVFGDIWDGLKKAFGTPIEFVIRTVLNNGIIKGINWILSQVGIDGIPNIPDPNLPTFATGGVVPGYAPGHDTVHALLSPGEGVLIPQAVKALGGARGIEAINASYGSGGTGPTMRGGLPGYDLGGFVSDILGGIGDAASAAWNGLKNVVLGGARMAAQGFFDGVVNPLVNEIPGGPNNIAKRAVAGMVTNVENGVLSFLGAKDQAALSSVSGAASSGVARDAQQYAAGRLAAYGWGMEQMGPLISLWNQECVPLRTRILTRRGWLNHDEVVVGDETIGYNPNTGRSEWTQITKVHHYESAETVRFGNKYWSVECTPNHKWWMEDIGRAWPEGVRPTGRRGYVPGSVEVVHGESLIETRHRRAKHRVVLARRASTGGDLPVSTQEAALLGWIAGDGSLTPGGSFAVYQAKEMHFAAIDEACHADPNWYQHRRKSVSVRGGNQKPCVTWTLSRGYSQDLLARVGNPKLDAVSQVLRMSSEQRAAWLDAIIRAEGSASDGKLSIYQNDGPVADAIEIAVYLSGDRPSRVKDARGGKVAWSINVTAPHIGGPSRKSFTESGPVQPVWCVTTELGSWTANQDGQVFLTGNSGWNPNAVNPSSGAYGIPQSLGHGHPYNLGDYVAQVDWGLNYIKQRYGSPAAAEQHEIAANWYDQGGYLMPGLTMVRNGTGAPEAVLTPTQTAALQRLAAGSGGGNKVDIHVHPREQQSELSIAHNVNNLLGHALRR